MKNASIVLKKKRKKKKKKKKWECECECECEREILTVKPRVLLYSLTLNPKMIPEPKYSLVVLSKYIFGLNSCINRLDTSRKIRYHNLYIT
jgi:hypothetical protein